MTTSELAIPGPTGSTAGRRPRVHRALAAAVAAIAVYLVVVWFSGVANGNLHTGDSDHLVAGARVALHCIDTGTFDSCGLLPGSRQTQVGPYPMLQYMPASALVWVGLSNDQVLKDLARLNVLAFGSAIVLCLVAFNRRSQRACRALAVLAIVASSATYQSSAALGEMLAAAVVLAAVVAVIKRVPALIVITCACAVLSKETFAPFVLVLGLLAGRDSQDRWLPPKRVLLPLVAGVVAGTLAAVGFNLFRFGQLTNTFYLDPRFRTPGIRRPLEFFAGLWLSPAAGLGWYWPIATAIVFAVGLAAVYRFTRNPRDVLSWLPAATLVLLGLAFTAGLGFWFSPFGWITYGPRLAVPLMPALAVTALHQEGDHVERIARRVTRTWVGTLAAIVVVLVIAWPQLGAAWSYRPAIDALVRADGTCPVATQLSIENDPGQYYDCVSHRMWQTTALPLGPAATGGGTPAFWARILLAGGIVLLLLDVRSGRVRGTAPDHAASPTDSSVLVTGVNHAPRVAAQPGPAYDR